MSFKRCQMQGRGLHYMMGSSTTSTYHTIIDFTGYELILHVKKGIELDELKPLISQFKQENEEFINKKYLSVSLKEFFLEKGYEVEYITLGPTIDLRKK